jgi:hypothetical protein
LRVCGFGGFASPLRGGQHEYIFGEIILKLIHKNILMLPRTKDGFKPAKAANPQAWSLR